MTEPDRPTEQTESPEALAILSRVDQLVDAVRLREAFAAADEGARRHPGSARLNYQRGNLAELLVSDEPDQAGRFAAIAEDGFTRALAIDPGYADAAAGVTRILDRKGDTAAAMAVLQPFLQEGLISPKLAAAYARIGPRVGEAERACRVLELVVEALGDTASIETLHDYARLLDRVGRCDEAFGVALRANQRAGQRYLSRGFQPGIMRKTIDATIAATTRRAMVEAPRATNRSALPVFIVGMGRSGTTLVEQIIDSHPEAHGAGERRALTRAASALTKATGIDAMAGMARWPLAPIEAIAKTYLADLADLAPGARRITDKLPQNFLRLGLVQRLLPAARIIHCRRDPRDILLSAFFEHQKIPAMEPWDLHRAALNYREQERLMAHWFEVLDLEILPVQYESLVQQPEVETRRIIAFLDLPWDERCLAIDENKRLVDTSNYASVRRRIHGDAVGRWRRYEHHLGPMIAGLRDGRESGPA